MNKNSTVRIGKGQSIIEELKDYTVIDLETTGFSPSFDYIIELGAIKVRNHEVIDSLSMVVNAGEDVYIDNYIQELTGISQEMVDKAPLISDVLCEFLDFIGDDIVIGHNVGFDVNFLFDSCMEITGKPFVNDHVNTVRFFRKLYPEAENHRLDTLAKIYSIDSRTNHRAEKDCFMAYHGYENMLKEIISTYDNFDNFKTLFKRSWKNRRGLKASDIVSLTNDFDEDSIFFKKVCVFTGKLEKMARKDAMQLVVDAGGLVGDTVTKKTNYLILGNNDYCKSIKGGKSSKQKKAEKYKLEGQDIDILPESAFYDALESF